MPLESNADLRIANAELAEQVRRQDAEIAKLRESLRGSDFDRDCAEEQANNYAKQVRDLRDAYELLQEDVLHFIHRERKRARSHADDLAGSDRRFANLRDRYRNAKEYE